MNKTNLVEILEDINHRAWITYYDANRVQVYSSSIKTLIKMIKELDIKVIINSDKQK